MEENKQLIDLEAGARESISEKSIAAEDLSDLESRPEDVSVSYRPLMLLDESPMKSFQNSKEN